MSTAAITATPASAPLLHGRRVLCAEDHSQMADLMNKVLSRAGHQVVLVFDGQQAIDQIVRQEFDVVVTDHYMPNVSGLELVAKLRSIDYRGKIVLHTSRLTAEEEAEYRALGIDAVLTKPGGILKLPALIR